MIFVARTGRQVDSPYSDEEAYALTSKLSADFAKKLTSVPISRLSYQQIVWLHILAVDSVAPKPAGPEIGDLTALMGLLLKARSSKLKWPKIRLYIEESNTFIRIGLDRQDRIKVEDDDLKEQPAGYDWPKPVWYGRIEDGIFSPSRKNHVEGLIEMLRKMAEDPIGTAKEFGRVTGRCCFCGSHLEDENSTAVGYGPSCAKHYALPWGAKAAQHVLELAA